MEYWYVWLIESHLLYKLIPPSEVMNREGWVENLIAMEAYCRNSRKIPWYSTGSTGLSNKDVSEIKTKLCQTQFFKLQTQLKMIWWTEHERGGAVRGAYVLVYINLSYSIMCDSGFLEVSENWFALFCTVSWFSSQFTALSYFVYSKVVARMMGWWTDDEWTNEEWVSERMNQ